MAMTAVHVSLLVAALASVARDPGRAADLAYGEYLASECVTCHGAPASEGAIPALVGLSQRSFVEVLRDYRAGRRSNPVMQNVARSLDDEQIEALAAYFASLREGGPRP